MQVSGLGMGVQLDGLYRDERTEALGVLSEEQGCSARERESYADERVVGVEVCTIYAM